MFIGSKTTDLYNGHEAETVLRTCGRVEYLVWRNTVPGDVVVNVGTTWLPLDLWLLDQRSKQRKITMAKREKNI